MKNLFKFGFLTLAISFSLTACSSNKTEEFSNKTEEPATATEKQSQTLTCDECGTTFTKSSGVQLSGHSQVFCSSRCATKWGFDHGISVN
jgi:protein-arginine kinase activator protein McsA